MVKRHMRLMGAGLLSLLAALPGHAQEPDESKTIPLREEDPALEEAEEEDGAVTLDTIEVTATRFIKSQRDIPGSVGAIRGETLEKMGAQNMRDYLKLIPGVSLTEVGRNADDNVPVIRGIATSAVFGATQLPVGIFVDELPFTDLGPPISVPDMNPFDVERIEVLKGPQGTLFGVGALSGAIRYILNQPQHSIWEGKLQLSAADTSFGGLSPTVAGALNVPIGDDIALRAVGLYRDRSGLVDRVTYDAMANRHVAEDTDSLRQTSGRLLANWQASDALKLRLSYFTQDTRQADTGQASNPETFERGGSPYDRPSRSQFDGLNLSGAYDFDPGTLLLSSSRMNKEVLRFTHYEDGAGTRVDDPRTDEQGSQQGSGGTGEFGGEDQRAVQLTTTTRGWMNGQVHELRFSSPEAGGAWQWLTGASYLAYDLSADVYMPTVDADGDQENEDPPLSPTGPVPTPIGPVTGTRDLTQLDALIRTNSSEGAVFGEALWRFSPNWEVTAGGRGYQTEVDASTVIAGAQGAAILLTTENHERQFTRERGFNPRLSLRYIHDPRIQAYVLASKGYQIGGAQLNPPILAFETIAEQRGAFRLAPYKSSTLWNYELGLRTEWFERRLRFDTTFFYLDWTDLQLAQTQPLFADEVNTVAPNNLGFQIIGNIGAAHSEGAEVALEMAPWPGVSFAASAAWVSALTDVEYVINSSTAPVPPGTRLPGTPRFQWSGVASYAHSLPYFSAWQGGVTLTHAYRSSKLIDLDGDDAIPGYATMDARLSLSNPSWRGQPELNFAINNLTDVRAIGYTSQGNRTRSSDFIAPRVALLSLALRF